MGFLSALVNGGSRTKVERLCSELGWEIEERLGKTTLGLHFNCPVIGQRTVYITSADGQFVFFWVSTEAVFDANNVPESVMKFALQRNAESIFGKWQPSLDKEEVSFKVSYLALGEALSATMVKCLCDAVAKEATVFDQKMKEEGYLT